MGTMEVGVGYSQAWYPAISFNLMQTRDELHELARRNAEDDIFYMFVEISRMASDLLAPRLVVLYLDGEEDVSFMFVFFGSFSK